MIDAKRIGKRLRALRAGKRQREIAQEIGVSLSAWGMYEIGARMPKDETKKRIAAHFGKSVQEIFYEG